MANLVRNISGYPASTDYGALWEFAQRQSVVCLVRYTPRHRWATDKDKSDIFDIAQTIAMPDDLGNFWCVDISCRGINYVQGFGKDDFAKQCKKAEVQWLIPPTAPIPPPPPQPLQ